MPATDLPSVEDLPTESAPAAGVELLGHVVAARPARQPLWRTVASVVATVVGLILFVASLSNVMETVVVPIRIVILLIGVVLFLGGLGGMIRRVGGPRTDVFFWISTGWLVVLTLAAVLADVLPLAESRDPSSVLTEPSLAGVDLLSSHPLGTDTSALDVLGQVVYGARVSIIIALGAVSVGIVVGGGLGLLAGYLRGPVEAVVGFVADVMLSLPPLILLMAMVTILKPTVLNLTVALGILVIPNFIRLARANTIKISSREFVVAARTLGARTNRILLREVLPNVVPSLIAYAFIVVGLLTVAEASLSFLGLGIQRPQPTWGNIIAQGQQYLQTEPHLVIAPAVFLFLTVLSANYVGQNLQRKWGV